MMMMMGHLSHGLKVGDPCDKHHGLAAQPWNEQRVLGSFLPLSKWKSSEVELFDKEILT